MLMSNPERDVSTCVLHTLADALFVELDSKSAVVYVQCKTINFVSKFNINIQTIEPFGQNNHNES